MSNKNLLKNNFKDLIIIKTADGIVHELWGLVKATRDKRLQWQFDQEYIGELRNQLNSKDTEKVKKAQEGLLFINAYVLAELDGNFHWLKELGVEPSEEFKKEIFNSRNAAQRDYISNNQGAQDELTDLIDPNETLTIGELADRMKETKKALRKQGKSVSELHKPKMKKSDKDKTQVLPVKKYSTEELAKFQQDYFKKNPKK